MELGGKVRIRECVPSVVTGGQARWKRPRGMDACIRNADRSDGGGSHL